MAPLSVEVGLDGLDLLGDDHLVVLHEVHVVVPQRRHPPHLLNLRLTFTSLTLTLKQGWEVYTEAKVDVTQEIEQRAQQTAQAGADHCTLCSISCVTSTLASV